jgi:hypothetical protein
MDDRSILAVRNSVAISRLLAALPQASTDTAERILWTLGNLTVDERARDIVSSEKGGLEVLVELLGSKNERISAAAVDIIAALSSNQKTAASLGQLEVPAHFTRLLSATTQPQTKEKVCWAIVRLCANHCKLVLLVKL